MSYVSVAVPAAAPGSPRLSAGSAVAVERTGESGQQLSLAPLIFLLSPQQERQTSVKNLSIFFLFSFPARAPCQSSSVLIAYRINVFSKWTSTSMHEVYKYS